MGKWCLQANSIIFSWFFVKLAGNQDRYKISEEFDFGPDRTLHFGDTCPFAETISSRLAFNFDPIFVKRAGNEDRHKISDEFDFGPDRTIRFEITCP